MTGLGHGSAHGPHAEVPCRTGLTVSGAFHGQIALSNRACRLQNSYLAFKEIYPFKEKNTTTPKPLMNAN